MSRVMGTNAKLLRLVPVSLKIDFSVKIISCSLNTDSPVILSPIRILPAPSPASKFVSKEGEVNVNRSKFAKNKCFLKAITLVALITSVGASTSAVKVPPSKRAGAFTPSTIAIFSVPVKLYSTNRVLNAPSLLKLIKVTTALSAGLEAKSGLIAKVEPPEDTVAVVRTVYTLSTPAIFDGGTFTALVEAPTDVISATNVIAFKKHLFFANLDLLTFTSPSLDTNFEAGDGAGSIRIGDNITGLSVFREQLIIFTEKSIFKLTGTSLSNFALAAITLDIGCIDGDTIQEIGGDIMFLTEDGLRLLSATDRIGDFGLGVVSKTIQDVMTKFISSASLFSSVVVRSKSQYRVFAFNPNVIGAASKGIIGTQFSPQGGEQMAWSEIRGMEVFAASSKVVDSREVIVFSSNTGILFKMEDGNSFDGSNIAAEYLSPFLPLNDPRTRKAIYKVYLYTDPVGSVNFDFSLKFDYDELNSVQPESISFTNATSAISFYGDNNFATYATTASGSSGATAVTVASNTNMVVGDGIVGTGIPASTTVTVISGTTITISAALTSTISNVRVTSSGSVFGGKVQNIFSTQTVGTGFTTAISFKSTSQDPPFSLDTAMLEYSTKSRR